MAQARLIVTAVCLAILSAHAVDARAEGARAEGAAERGTRFVVVGHTYPIETDRAQLDALLAAIAAEQPDHVFLLGDCSLEKREMFDYYRSRIAVPLHYAPGNHEVMEPDHRSAYLSHVGYLDAVFSTADCNFILLNSSQGADDTRAFLERTDEQVDHALPTVLLTHHRIWDDTRLSPEPYRPQKSYLFAEVQPTLAGRVEYLFAGNSKLHYFRELKNRASYGKQNVHNIFWCDRIGDLTCYSVGMGEGRPKAGFVVVDVVDGRLLVEPRYVAADEVDVTHAEITRKDDIVCRPRSSLDRENRKRSALAFAAGFLSMLALAVCIIVVRFGPRRAVQSCISAITCASLSASSKTRTSSMPPRNPPRKSPS